MFVSLFVSKKHFRSPHQCKRDILVQLKYIYNFSILVWILTFSHNGRTTYLCTNGRVFSSCAAKTIGSSVQSSFSNSLKPRNFTLDQRVRRNFIKGLSIQIYLKVSSKYFGRKSLNPSYEHGCQTCPHNGQQNASTAI